MPALKSQSRGDGPRRSGFPAWGPCCLLFLAALLPFDSTRAGAPSPTPAPAPAAMAEVHRAFFKSYCLNCHDEKEHKGKVRLDDLKFEISDVVTAERWQKVLNALNSGDMPPEDEKQPPAQNKTLFLDHLAQAMVLARRQLNDHGGLITMRRLNRREYENTIRDLLGVQVDAATLPNDTGSGGFDTMGKSLFFSSDQLEQYLALARTAINEAAVTGPRPARRRVHRECEAVATPVMKKALANLLDLQSRAQKAIATKEAKKFGFDDVPWAKFQLGDAGMRIPIHKQVLEHPLSKTGAFLTLFAGYPQDVTTFPPEAPAGKYLLHVRAACLEAGPGSQHFIEIGQSDGNKALPGALTVLGCYQVTGTPEKPQTLEIPVTVKKSGNRTFILRQRQHNDRQTAKEVFLAMKDANGIGPPLSLWLDSVDWEGPYTNDWPPVSALKVFGSMRNVGQDEASAREIIRRFAVRAFRGRPVEDAFLDSLMQVFQHKREAGAGFEEAIKEPLAIILASPSFLYLVEPVTKPDAPRELTPVELANRLSYFLWSAPPDNTLTVLARNGELMKPAVLAQQVERMIGETRAWGFVTGFVGQWLHMERLDFFQFNPQLYPSFDHSAQIAARDEVYHTFLTVMRDGLGLGQLLKSDFVVVNDLMADYYGISGVKGPDYRKVPVPEGMPRGGLLSMAAILAMGSDGERSSPVERGAFVLRRLLNAPPPPAPANVPQLSRLAGKALPARKLLAAHMEQAQCAACHRKIDPIGFGLENFNAAGLWRPREEIVEARVPDANSNLKPGLKIGDFAIDASGQLPDGTAFKDYFSLRDAIAGHAGVFARGVTEALVEYALGRPLCFQDEDLVSGLLATTRPHEYPLRDIIQGLVLSRTFHLK